MATMSTLIDMTGEVYGMLTVEEYVGERKWRCKCSCGRGTIVRRPDLISGKTKSCGCKGTDITGQKFGRLTVLKRMDRIDSQGRRLYECLCECGKVTYVNSHDLKNGSTKSCGCLGAELFLSRITKHGAYKTRLYKVWGDMKNRCTNKNNDHYKDYGGRGITVCDDWMRFESFRDWAFSHGYDEYAKFGVCTLDRIDVNGNYCPENCRWVDAKTQSNNKRTNVYLEFDGQRHTISEWSEITGIGKTVIRQRILSGWDVEKALTTIPKPGGKYEWT